MDEEQLYIINKIQAFLGTLNGAKKVNYDNMQNLIRFEFCKKEFSISIDSQEISSDVLIEKNK